MERSAGVVLFAGLTAVAAHKVTLTLDGPQAAERSSTWYTCRAAGRAISTSAARTETSP